VSVSLSRLVTLGSRVLARLVGAPLGAFLP
jgi:hypothetical protein